MRMRLTAALRDGVPALFSFTSASLLSSTRSPTAASPFLVPASASLFGLWRRRCVVALRFRLSSSATPPPSPPPPSGPASSSSTSNTFATLTTVPMEKQFVEFQTRLEESGTIRERIRAVVAEMEAAIRIMQSTILLLHQSLPVPEVLAKAGVQNGVLKELFGRLREILRECPGWYYRYHGDWRSEAQTVVSLLALLHWLETGNLLLHREVEEKLGLDALEFGLDVEDYLVGLCFMSNEMPRYVVNQVTAGDYDCPRKVLKFLTDLHASFRMLNLRNDFLRKKFDSMKYDLRKVEEVFYDVKIRGLASETKASEEA